MRRRAVRLRLPVLAQDALLGATVAVMHVQGVLAKPPDAPVRPLTDFAGLGFVLLVLSGLALTFRRRWPAAVFVVAALASLTYFTLDFSDGPGWIGLFVSLYTLTAYGDGRRSVAVASVGIAVLATGWLIAGADVEPRAAIGWVFFRIAASVMAAALGESVRTRRVVAAEALERAALAERTREEEAHARVEAERLRIAREVHDTVAHAVAIINVQAGVTAYMLDKHPERVREALVTIERTSAQALHEMRAVLGVLRDSDDGRAPEPRPGPGGRARRDGPRGGAGHHPRRAATHRAAAKRGGAHRVPHHAGGTDQRNSPCRPHPGDASRRLLHRRARDHGD